MSMTSEPSAQAGVPPTVLAIDTTAGACSVALLSSGTLVRRAEPMIHGHSRRVLALVDAVLEAAGTAPGAVDAIGFGSGPGSFTGLRIACGIAQGLGFGWRRPLVAVDAMRTLGLQAVAARPMSDAGCAGSGEFGQGAARVIVALDLRMGQVCVAVFRTEAFDAAAGWPQPEAEPALMAPDAARTLFEALPQGPVLLAGDGFDVYPLLAEWVAAAPLERHRNGTAVQPDASAVALLAARGLRLGLSVDAALAAPTYLRDKVALDVTEQAALRAARAAALMP
jgi:tRNA threonylcarbamoyladenosine biosynthesis protein TsaB